MPRFPHILPFLPLVSKLSYDMLPITHISAIYIFPTLCLYIPSKRRHALYFSAMPIISSSLFIFHFCVCLISSPCHPASSPDSTACFTSPPLREARLYTVKLGHNPLNGTHTLVLQHGRQEMCAFTCACTLSFLCMYSMFLAALANKNSG